MLIIPFLKSQYLRKNDIIADVMLETQQLREAHHLKIWFLLPGQRLQLKMRCFFFVLDRTQVYELGFTDEATCHIPGSDELVSIPSRPRIDGVEWFLLVGGNKKAEKIIRRINGVSARKKKSQERLLGMGSEVRRCLRGDLVPIFVAQLYQLQRSPAVASKTPGSLEPSRCEVPIAIHCRYEALNLTCQGASTGRDPFWEFFLVTLSRVKTWPLFGGSIRVTWKKLVVEFKYAILQYSNHSNFNPPF